MLTVGGRGGDCGTEEELILKKVANCIRWLGGNGFVRDIRVVEVSVCDAAELAVVSIAWWSMLVE